MYFNPYRVMKVSKGEVFPVYVTKLYVAVAISPVALPCPELGTSRTRLFNFTPKPLHPSWKSFFRHWTGNSVELTPAVLVAVY